MECFSNAQVAKSLIKNETALFSWNHLWNWYIYEMKAQKCAKIAHDVYMQLGSKEMIWPSVSTCQKVFSFN